MSEPHFEQVIAEGVALQQRFPGEPLVAVGGTAAALHCGHRYSLDVVCVTPELRHDYPGYLDRLESWEGWRTNRRNPPVLILGERQGVELGLRQLRRTQPLETTTLRGLVVPTLEETLRVKAFLLAERRATRDFVEVAALIGRLGVTSAPAALTSLNHFYPLMGVLTPISAFAEGAEVEPADFDLVPLNRYKGLRPPFSDWDHVTKTLRSVSRELLRQELGSDRSVRKETP